MTSAQDGLTIVLAHGAWADGSSWEGHSRVAESGRAVGRRTPATHVSVVHGSGMWTELPQPRSGSGDADVVRGPSSNIRLNAYAQMQLPHGTHASLRQAPSVLIIPLLGLGAVNLIEGLSRQGVTAACIAIVLAQRLKYRHDG